MSLFAKRPMNGPEFQRLKSPKYMTIDERLGNWANQFKRKAVGFVYCPGCGKTILNDNLILQKHMQEVHRKDKIETKNKMFRFHVTGKPTFADNAFNNAKKIIRDNKNGKLQK